jgi:hypothetical protein
MQSSRIDQSVEYGLVVIGSDAIVEDSMISNSAATPDGLFGDGIGVLAETAETKAELHRTMVTESARAGLSSFGADVSLEALSLICNDIALDGEPHLGQDFVFVDLGDNLCGCPAATDTCKVVSTGLTPPEPL